MSRYPFLFALLLPALLVSGCVAPIPGVTTGTVSGAGVTIEAFEPDFKQIYTGEPVQLQLKVKNTGSVDATDVNVEIFGIEWGDPEEGTTCPLSDSKGKIADKLIAPDPARGTAGGSQTCIFTYKGGQVPEGLTLTFNPSVRVRYQYSSETVKTITLLPIAEARRIEQGGQKLPSETTSSTNSPIALTITTKGPIRVFEDGVEFPIEVQIKNVGGGVVATSTDSKDWNKLDYVIKLPAEGVTATTDCKLSGTLTLFKGQTNTISCLVKADSVGNPTLKQVTVSTSNYYYFIDKTTSITVTGRKTT